MVVSVVTCLFLTDLAVTILTYPALAYAHAVEKLPKEFQEGMAF